MVVIFGTISSLLVPETITKFSQVFVLRDSRQSSFMIFVNAAKTILGESSFIFSAIFFHFRPAKPIASARLTTYEIRQYYLACYDLTAQ